MGGSQSAEPVSPPPEITRPNVVVIPVDQSKQAEAAFLWYVRHIHREGNVVQIVHCTEWPATSNMTSEEVQQNFDEVKKRGKEIIDHYQRRMEQFKVPGSVHFEFGHPGESVVNASERFKACHIVMGTRGFGLIRRTILGSVSEFVTHHSKIPVTVVPRETINWFF